MWTYVYPSSEAVVEDGLAVGEVVQWRVRAPDEDDELPVMPPDLEGTVDRVEVDDGGERASGTITRIIMLTGRRRTAASEITATPAEHVQVLDLAGFLVALDPAST
ncbi:hypothetical protein [Aeromicrobium sp.]|uniref:hypothetical protein n=1 Tax=Aeromicrobium sp. TaxID=1871063 RepID=UPI003C5D21C9